MPELPDVEVFKNYFNENALHKEISRVEISAPEMLRQISANKLEEDLEGKTFLSGTRYGKYLLAELDNNSWLVFHFGVTGFLKFFEQLKEDTPHDRFRFDFAKGGHLGFDCQRKLGEIELINDIKQFIEHKSLGPDPMAPDFEFSDFKAVAGKRKGAIKTTLMNQEVIAGVGNVYSDEILFQAGIHPGSNTANLDNADLEKIYKMMLEVLKTAIDSNADPDKLPDGYMLPQRKIRGTCPRCRSDLINQKFGGRTAYICPECQVRK